MGGKHFTVPCIVSQNGYGVTLTALTDTGANGFAFMNTLCAIDIAKFLNVKAKRLVRPIHIKGFDGRSGKAISHVLSLNLSIDGQRQEEIPFLILDLGTHDVILGLKWMSYFNVWLNPRDKRLMWPDDPDRTTAPSFYREIQVPRTSLQSTKPNREHQRDAAARDRALELEDVRQRASKASQPVRILPRPVNRVEHASLEEQDSGYESTDQVEVRTTKGSTYEKDIRDRIHRI
jgi:hypothetical protein